MDRFNRHALQLTEGQDFDAACAAKSVHRDFSDLVALFDRQLAGLAETEIHARSHVAKAKAAAERGLVLSEQLIEVLRG